MGHYGKEERFGKSQVHSYLHFWQVFFRASLIFASKMVLSLKPFCTTNFPRKLAVLIMRNLFATETALDRNGKSILFDPTKIRLSFFFSLAPAYL